MNTNLDDILDKKTPQFCKKYESVPGARIGKGDKLTVTYIDGRVTTYVRDSNGEYTSENQATNRLELALGSEMIRSDEIPEALQSRDRFKNC